MLRIVTALAVVGVSLPASDAVLVSPNSPCAVNCGNTLGTTNPTDIGCLDVDYAHDDPQIFAGCVKCEMNSRYFDGNQTDVGWSLYNMRYAVSSCLWGTPSDLHRLNDSPCIINKACEVFQKGIEYRNLSSSATGYEYCDFWDTADQIDFKGCTDCLQADRKTNYLANFVTMLQAGCEQKPVPGVTVAVKGNVFSSDNVNVTAPTPMATVDPAWFDHGPLNLGAKVGIAIGGFVFLLILTGFAIVCNGKRRRKAFLKELDEKYTRKGWPPPTHHDDTLETPSSQRPLRAFEDSPMSPSGPYPPYISPYQSQYNSPVSAQDMVNMSWPAAALSKDHKVGYAISPDDNKAAHDWDLTQEGDIKGKGVVEAYEMHDVESNKSSANSGNQNEAVVLNDPVHWRKRSSESYHSQLAQDDARRGYAV